MNSTISYNAAEFLRKWQISRHIFSKLSMKNGIHIAHIDSLLSPSSLIFSILYLSCFLDSHFFFLHNDVTYFSCQLLFDSYIRTRHLFILSSRRLKKTCHTNSTQRSTARHNYSCAQEGI